MIHSTINAIIQTTFLIGSGFDQVRHLFLFIHLFIYSLGNSKCSQRVHCVAWVICLQNARVTCNMSTVEMKRLCDENRFFCSTQVDDVAELLFQIQWCTRKLLQP